MHVQIVLNLIMPVDADHHDDIELHENNNDSITSAAGLPLARHPSDPLCSAEGPLDAPHMAPISMQSVGKDPDA